MSMAESIHSQPCDKVEIFLPIEVEKKNALAALDDYWVAVIRLQQKLFFALDYFFGTGHGVFLRKRAVRSRKWNFHRGDKPTLRGNFVNHAVAVASANCSAVDVAGGVFRQASGR